MDARAKEWRRITDELWAGPFDYRAAAQLAADIARGSNGDLREAASQALPSLRAATVRKAERLTRDVARRRFEAVRNALHALDMPRFGRRSSGDEVLTPDEAHRRMLGLPLGRRLFGPEITAAFKRAAKRAHPDAGGSERAFLALSEARDALLRGG